MKTLRIGDIVMTEAPDGVEVVKIGRGTYVSSDGQTRRQKDGAPFDEFKITIPSADRAAFAELLNGSA